MPGFLAWYLCSLETHEMQKTQNLEQNVQEEANET